MSNSWSAHYDSSLKDYYYTNGSQGTIQFDHPSEVRTGKQSFFGSLKRKLSPRFTCSRKNSGTSAVSESRSSLDEQTLADDERHSANYTYQPIRSNPSYDSLISLESYVSSIDESIVNENVNRFYNNKDEPMSPVSTRSSYNSNRSLTIMNPEEFIHHDDINEYSRGNIDDYEDSDIESLHHEDFLSSDSEVEEEISASTGIDYIYSDAHLLFKQQLDLEMLRFEQDIVA